MTTLSAEVTGTLVAAIGSAVALWVGRRKGFFTLAHSQLPTHAPSLFLVLFAFALYLLSGFTLPYFFSSHLPLMSTVGNITWSAFLTSVVGCIALFVMLFLIPSPIRKTILLRRSTLNYKYDLLLALCAWLISLPIVLCMGSLLELLLYAILHTFELPDQIAVLFLRMTLQHPLYLGLAALSIVVLAPLLEELLFRGFLQTYLRRYFSPSVAIAASALCFALFHYSKDQGPGNLPIVGSLFVLGWFLGYLYERQGSLLSPLCLHALFNLFNVINLAIWGTPLDQ